MDVVVRTDTKCQIGNSSRGLLGNFYRLTWVFLCCCLFSGCTKMKRTQRVVNDGDESHDYPAILRILGFFSSSFSRKRHHPCLPIAPPISQGMTWVLESSQAFPKSRDSSSLASRFCDSAFAVWWDSEAIETMGLVAIKR